MSIIINIIEIIIFIIVIIKIIDSFNKKTKKNTRVKPKNLNTFGQKIRDLKGMKNMKKYKRLIITVILSLFILIVIFSSVKAVPTGTVGVKTRFGAVQKSVINEGINLKVPFIEKIVLINCKTQKIETTSESSTRDMQTVNVAIAVNYNVNKETANSLYQEVGINYEEIIIRPAMLESIKSSMAQYTAEELITKRSEVSDKIKETLISKISARGFVVTGFNITDIAFSDTYNQAIEQKAVAQQQVETAKANLEKQQIVNQQRISVAETDAEVMRLQNSQITDNTLRLKEIENQKAFIEKWNGVLPSTMLSDKISTIFGVGN